MAEWDNPLPCNWCSRIQSGHVIAGEWLGDNILLGNISKGIMGEQPVQ